MSEISFASMCVAQIVRRDDTERSDRRKHPHFGRTEVIVASVHMDPLTFEAARKVEVPGEDISWIDGF